ncbi:molybdopterin-dependent oxidoreductase [Planctomicrobium sp. SH664]|uniref:molybdopterin-dependent oxidoreductase n=1 Tax=Planctomicrobium sp. SH664 TaxID=3448125 RepID=UPI003F5B6522
MTSMPCEEGGADHPLSQLYAIHSAGGARKPDWTERLSGPHSLSGRRTNAASERILTPLKRNAHNELAPVDWDLALREFVGRTKEIQWRYGKGAVAYLVSEQLTNEELALQGILARTGMGLQYGATIGDWTTTPGPGPYQRAFGYEMPPFHYSDLEDSDLILLIGDNWEQRSPGLWNRIQLNAHATVLTIHADAARVPQPPAESVLVLPGSEAALIHGLARCIVTSGNVDRDWLAASTAGFQDYIRFLQGYDLDKVTEATGLPAGRIEALARLVTSKQRVSLWTDPAVTKSPGLAEAVIDLALLTGQIGRPGTGPNLLSGAGNRLGAALFSNLKQLPGGHDFENMDGRHAVAGCLGVEESLLPRQASGSHADLLDGIRRGTVKGLWVLASGSSQSWMEEHFPPDVLSQLELLVVQDGRSGWGTSDADLVLPSASWGEKSGTYMNSERRVGTLNVTTIAPGETLPDFNILKLIAHYWGCGTLFEDWTSPADAFQILKELTRGTPADMSGITDYALLDSASGIQWPFPEKAAPTSRNVRPFEEGKFAHADGRARFLCEPAYATRLMAHARHFSTR